MNRVLLDRLFPFVRAQVPEQVEFSLSEHGTGRCFAFTPLYGNVLAVGLADGTIALYDLVTRALAKKLYGHTSDVFSLSFVPRSTWLLSTSLDGSLRLWDVSQLRCIVCVRFEAQLARASAHPRFRQNRLCCVSQTGQPVLLVQLPVEPGEYHVTQCPSVWVLWSGPASTLTMSAQERTPTETLQVPECAHVHASDTEDGNSVCTRNSDALPPVPERAPLLRELGTHGAVELPPTLTGSITMPVAYLAAEFDPTGAYIITHAAEQPGLLKVFKIERATEAGSGPRLTVHCSASFALPPRAFVKQIQFAERGDLFLVVAHDRIVRVFEWKPFEPNKVRLWRELKDRVSSVQWRWAAFASHDEFLVAGTAASADHRLYIWDLKANQLVKQLDGRPKESLSMLAYHANLHALLVLVYQSGSILVYHKTVAENWSAYAPSFREVSENVEYVEAEDEFDFDPDGSSVYDRRRRKHFAPADEDAIVVDITGRLPDSDPGYQRFAEAGWNASSSSSMSSSNEELLCLPVDIPLDLPPLASEASWIGEYRALRRHESEQQSCSATTLQQDDASAGTSSQAVMRTVRDDPAGQLAK
jgi:WD40 repeat protein